VLVVVEAVVAVARVQVGVLQVVFVVVVPQHSLSLSELEVEPWKVCGERLLNWLLKVEGFLPM